MANNRSEMKSVKSYKAKVECLCPRCYRKHVLTMRWAGKGTPWKLCKNCKELGDTSIG